MMKTASNLLFSERPIYKHFRILRRSFSGICVESLNDHIGITKESYGNNIDILKGSQQDLDTITEGYKI